MTGGEEKGDLGTGIRLRPILAGDASPMTGPGTTTWVLGEGAVTVIDPGPDLEAHLEAILACLEPREHVEAILLTHPHLDHSGLVARLRAATGAPVLGPARAGAWMRAEMRALVAAGLSGGGEGVDEAWTPDRLLEGGEVLELACGPIQVLRTPGHMAEHLAFGLGDTLFCGDLLMAWAPSLISPPHGDLGAWLGSLARVREGNWRQLVPTHGAVIEEPRARIDALIAHRMGREAQVLEALAAGPGDLGAVTARVYAGLAPALMNAASRNALAHLIHLIGEGRVTAAPWPARDAVFALKHDQPSVVLTSRA